MINKIVFDSSDLDKMLKEVLENFLKIFTFDRAWLLYPCDPAPL